MDYQMDNNPSNNINNNAENALDTNANSPKKKSVLMLVVIIIIIAVILIAVGGVLAYQYFTVKTQPTTQTQVQSTTDQTKDWKTFTSYTSGHILRYPNDWVIYESDKVIIASKNSRYDLPNYGPMSARYFAEISFSGNQVTVSRQGFTKFPGQFGGPVEYLNLTDEFLKSTEEYKIAQIIIESVNSSGSFSWKTYINKEKGFEIKYPSNIEIQDGLTVNFLLKNGIVIISHPVDLEKDIQDTRQYILNNADNVKKEVDGPRFLDSSRATEIKYSTLILKPMSTSGYQIEVFAKGIKNNIKIYFQTVFKDGNDRDMAIAIFNQMLSTFKFTPVK